jgi:hypothetical protein
MDQQADQTAANGTALENLFLYAPGGIFSYVAEEND